MPVPYNNIYADAYDRSSLGSNYTNVGTASISIVSNKLQMSGGNGTFNNYSKITGTSITNLEEYNIVYRFVTSVQGTGLWVGTESVSANNAFSACCFANLSNTGSRGYVSLWINGSQVGSSSSTPLTFNDGDSLELTAKRKLASGSGFQYIITLSNLTTPANPPATTTVTINPVPSSSTGNIGYFSIGTLGGTSNGFYLNIDTQRYKNPDFVVIGHSIVQGYNLSLNSARFADQIFTGTNYSYNVLGSGGALLTEVLNNMREITEMRPKKAIIMIGLNEVILGTDSATYKANYTSMINQLNQAGIQCIHCACTPYNGVNTANVATYNTDIQGLIGKDQWIDTYNPMLGSGTNMSKEFIDADGIHPNSVGHAKLAELIKAAIGIPASIYDVATLGYININKTRPSNNFISALNTMIAGMRSDGDWVHISRAWLFATETQNNAVIPLKSNSTTVCTEVLSPSWTMNQGYAGNGTTSYINANYIPSSNSVYESQNSTCFGVYIRTNTGAANKVDMGSNDTTKSITAYTKWGDGKIYSNINDNTAGSIVTATSASGMTHWERTSATNVNMYRNGVSLGSIVANSVGLPTKTIYIGAWNNNGIAANFSDRQISFAYIGDSSVNQLNIYNRFQTFMTALGTQV